MTAQLKRWHVVLEIVDGKIETVPWCGITMLIVKIACCFTNKLLLVFWKPLETRVKFHWCQEWHTCSIEACENSASYVAKWIHSCVTSLHKWIHSCVTCLHTCMMSFKRSQSLLTRLTFKRWNHGFTNHTRTTLAHHVFQLRACLGHALRSTHAKQIILTNFTCSYLSTSHACQNKVWAKCAAKCASPPPHPLPASTIKRPKPRASTHLLIKPSLTLLTHACSLTA